MNYENFIKKFNLPPTFKALGKLVFEDLTARPLTKDDLEDDLAAVNSSIGTIRKTRGGSWPEGPLDKEFDFEDLAWHQREFRDATSFAYVIYNSDNRYIGCFYLYPMGIRTELTEDMLQYDVDASWWVTTQAYENGYYEKTYRGLQQWLADSFPFQRVYYSNREMPGPIL